MEPGGLDFAAFPCATYTLANSPQDCPLHSVCIYTTTPSTSLHSNIYNESFLTTRVNLLPSYPLTLNSCLIRFLCEGISHQPLLVNRQSLCGLSRLATGPWRETQVSVKQHTWETKDSTSTPESVAMCKIVHQPLFLPIPPYHHLPNPSVCVTHPPPLLPWHPTLQPGK